MQRLPGLAVLPVHLAQVPAPAMRSQHEQQAHRNLDAARYLLPVGRDEQDNAARDEDRADEGDDRQELAPLFLQFEMLNNLPLLLRRDQPGVLDLLNVLVFHNGQSLADQPTEACIDKSALNIAFADWTSVPAGKVYLPAPCQCR